MQKEPVWTPERLKKSTQSDEYEDVLCLIEANDFERHCLWERYADSGVLNMEAKKNGKLLNWKQGSGNIVSVAWMDKRPINVSIFIVELNQIPVVFWHPVSELVDYKAIEGFLENVFGQTLYDNRLDTSSFHSFFGQQEQLLSLRQQKVLEKEIKRGVGVSGPRVFKSL